MGMLVQKMTQLELLRAAFDRGESLTVLHAIERYGIFALSQRCGELFREGYPVLSEPLTLPNGKRVARYRKANV